MIQLPPLEAIKYRSVARLQARERLARRSAPNEHSYVTRCSYNAVVTNYIDCENVARFGGSSLNRRDAKKDRDERLEGLKKKAVVTQKVGKDLYEYTQYVNEITSIRDFAHHQQGVKARIARASGRGRKLLHMLSKRSAAKVKEKATAFFQACDKKKVFVTLSFINKVDDKQAVRILNKFLNELRKEKKGLQYLWVAERQLNNTKHPGNIHFHIIINRFLPVKKYNALWVLQQYNAGIQHETLTMAELNRLYAASDYDAISDHLNPFDVEKVNGIYGISWYLTKYVTKGNIKEGFTCQAWNCSRGVSALFTSQITGRSCLAAANNPLVNRRWMKKQKRFKTGQMFKGAFWNTFMIENRTYFLKEIAEMEQINKWLLQGLEIDRVPTFTKDELRLYFSLN